MSGIIQRQLTRIQWFFKNYRYINPNIILQHKKPSYNAEGLIVYNNCDNLDEPQFKQAYEKSMAVKDWRITDPVKFDMRWRYYFVCFFANHVKKLEGDFVECGVYKGGYAMAIMNYVDFPQLKKQFWLLDTYKGLPAELLTEKEISNDLHNEYNHYEDSYDWVCELFKQLPAKIIKGVVPNTLGQCTAEKVCYLSLDMNSSVPEIAAANFFWDKLVQGGVIILDDYGFMRHIEQKIAFDRFAKEKNVSILQLPTGQGVIFKP